MSTLAGTSNAQFLYPCLKSCELHPKTGEQFRQAFYTTFKIDKIAPGLEHKESSFAVFSLAV